MKESDGGAGQKNEGETEVEVAGHHQERLVGKRIVRGRSARPSSMKSMAVRHSTVPHESVYVTDGGYLLHAVVWP